ncbi:MAG: hypothetical protein Q8Q60_03655 [Candidatus Chromulinivorax sp.]|nr:hypothetical protein [Candidatus Chromulinivorax sp.]
MFKKIIALVMIGCMVGVHSHPVLHAKPNASDTFSKEKTEELEFIEKSCKESERKYEAYNQSILLDRYMSPILYLHYLPIRQKSMLLLDMEEKLFESAYNDIECSCFTNEQLENIVDDLDNKLENVTRFKYRMSEDYLLTPQMTGRSYDDIESTLTRLNTLFCTTPKKTITDVERAEIHKAATSSAKMKKRLLWAYHKNEKKDFSPEYEKSLKSKLNDVIRSHIDTIESLMNSIGLALEYNPDDLDVTNQYNEMAAELLTLESVALQIKTAEYETKIQESLLSLPKEIRVPILQDLYKKVLEDSKAELLQGFQR